MKANQKVGNGRQDRAESGIGTMIVFIAFVIVAAVAAAVLINTSNNLQRKASETGKETTQEVAANMFVRDIIGTVASSKITTVEWYLSLAPGAEPVDLTTTKVRYVYSGDLSDLGYAASCTANDFSAVTANFCIVNVFDAGDASTTVLSEGDRVKVQVTLTAAKGIEVRKSVDALILPEAGAPVLGSFKTPPTYGTSTYISLL